MRKQKKRKNKNPDWQRKKWFWCRQIGVGGGMTTADVCINREANPKKFKSFDDCSDCNKVEYFRALKAIASGNVRKMKRRKKESVPQENNNRKLKRRLKRRRHAKKG